jgi:hypothetical protein
MYLLVHNIFKVFSSQFCLMFKLSIPRYSELNVKTIYLTSDNLLKHILIDRVEF